MRLGGSSLPAMGSWCLGLPSRPSRSGIRPMGSCARLCRCKRYSLCHGTAPIRLISGDWAVVRIGYPAECIPITMPELTSGFAFRRCSRRHWNRVLPVLPRDLGGSVRLCILGISVASISSFDSGKHHRRLYHFHRMALLRRCAGGITPRGNLITAGKDGGVPQCGIARRRLRPSPNRESYRVRYMRVLMGATASGVFQ